MRTEIIYLAADLATLVSPDDAMFSIRRELRQDGSIENEEIEIQNAVEKADWKLEFDVNKVDDQRQWVFGWASVARRANGETVIDRQDDIIEPEDLEAAVYDFVLEHRETGEMHVGGSKGRLIESVVFTPEKLAKLGLEATALPLGWWVGFHVEDAAAFGKIKSGAYKMWSIQGHAQREVVT